MGIIRLWSDYRSKYDEQIKSHCPIWLNHNEHPTFGKPNQQQGKGLHV